VQILGLLDANGGRPPLAPKGSVAAGAQPPALEEAAADISGDESSATLVDERKMSMAPEEEVLEDEGQEYVM
jgi:hypothetical protein